MDWRKYDNVSVPMDELLNGRQGEGQTHLSLERKKLKNSQHMRYSPTNGGGNINLPKKKKKGKLSPKRKMLS